jgi:two-component system, OmpR family, KDP operon response regulator KdpE
MLSVEKCRKGGRENPMEKEAAKKRILVIDDDEQVLISLQCLLENEGYETTVAWSGQEGLALLRSRGFDLILLDDYLRDIEHEEIFNEIRGMGTQPLVILTESSLTPETRRYFLDMGAATIVGKRAPCVEIADEVRDCLERASLQTV